MGDQAVTILSTMDIDNPGILKRSNSAPMIPQLNNSVLSSPVQFSARWVRIFYCLIILHSLLYILEFDCAGKIVCFFLILNSYYLIFKAYDLICFTGLPQQIIMHFLSAIPDLEDLVQASVPVIIR